MKKIFRLIIPVTLLASCKTVSYQPAGQNYTRQEYIRQFAPIAMQEMKRTGVPASIKLAQAVLESGDGSSRLAKTANNHFGIKCHEWSGSRIYHDDDHRGECFRKYRSPEDSFKDHSDFLTGRSRYAFLFNLNPSDYKAWAAGLRKAGYATNPNYDRMLIKIIEDNQLFQYDRPGTARRNDAGRNESTVTVSKPEGTRIIDTLNHIKYIVVKEGDTFASLAKELNLMQWELPRFNETSADRELIRGELIYLQPKKNRAAGGNDIHTVVEGETIYKISQLYGVKMERLLRMNRLNPGEEPQPGEKIWLRKNKPDSGTEHKAPKIEFEL